MRAGVLRHGARASDASGGGGAFGRWATRTRGAGGQRLVSDATDKPLHEGCGVVGGSTCGTWEANDMGAWLMELQVEDVHCDHF
jgi:hypothetical protein